MANWQVISLDTTTPQLRAPGTGDGYSFNSGSTQLGVWTTTGLGIGTALTVDGNATLGNASTDTVTVSGRMGIGAAGLSHLGMFVSSSAVLTGQATAVASVRAGGTFGSDVTSDGSAFIGKVNTAAASFTLTNARGLFVDDATKGAGSTITNLYGLYIADQTQGTNNYGITSLVSSGSNKWNIYASGTADNYFAGNVGIGTASPAAKLDIVDGVFSVANTATSVDNTIRNLTATGTTGETTGISFDVANNANGVRIYAQRDGTYGSAATRIASFRVATTTGGVESEKFVISGDGNVGIGTTSPATKLHVAAGSVTVDNTYGYLAADSAGTRESILSISSGNNVTVAAPTLSGSLQYAVRNASGSHQFFSGGSERARIDSSGRLLVGGTSAQGSSTAGSVDIQNTGSNLFAATRFISGSSGPFLALQKSRSDTVGTNTIVADGDTLGTIMFGGANGTGYSDAAFIRGQVDGTPGASADMPGRLVFATSADGSASPTERMRIANGGAVGVNSTNPAGLAQLAIRWDATATTVNNGIAVGIRTNTATADVSYITFFSDTGAGIGSVTRVAATNAVAYNTTSDIRLKENVAAADDAGSVIDAIEIVKHDWKDGGHVRYGVIAQDLRTVAPEAVSPGDDGDEIKRAWGVDYSKLVPMLVKEIQSLRARVAQLEAK